MSNPDKGPSILIIEGDFLKARLLAESFRTYLDPTEVRLAHDGEQAFEAIQQFDPDVILLNMNLSRPSGVEFMRMLRQGTTRLNGYNLVAMTQRGQGDMRVTAQLFGASAVVEYPYSPMELSRAVQQATEGPDDADVR